MATRWRVTWTRERRKKKPKKFDGELVVDESGRATLYETGEAEDGDGDDDAETKMREVTSEKLRRDVVETMEAGVDGVLAADNQAEQEGRLMMRAMLAGPLMTSSRTPTAS